MEENKNNIKFDWASVLNGEDGTPSSNAEEPDNSAGKPEQDNKDSHHNRTGKIKITRWIRFSVVTLLYIGLVAWIGNWWLLLLLPFIADAYLTHFIPWRWWKRSKSRLLRGIMTVVETIIYVLVFLYLIFTFIGRQYMIPSSSMEKSFLVGDHLWVSMITYGPRIPNTPLNFPFTTNTLPLLNCKSYIESPQWPYHRLRGLRNIERNDVVVFNFPAGDTVATKCPSIDYYSLVKQFGRSTVWTNKNRFGDIIFRPVDRRDNYVKRAIGLPGEWLRIKDNIVYINGKAIAEPRQVQYNYFIQTDGRTITDAMWQDLRVNSDEHPKVAIEQSQVQAILQMGFQVKADGSVLPIYQIPLTSKAKENLNRFPWIIETLRVPMQETSSVYPIGTSYGWDHTNYGPIWIPKKGRTLKLTLNNLPLYMRCIVTYEGNKVEVYNHRIYINSQPTDRYTFKMNYYWMMGDNRDNSFDSRYWGFVPEDHIIGTPILVVASIDHDKPLFKGGIRWNRIFSKASDYK
jgi:signal peptidase I